MRRQLRIIFMGTPEFAVPGLEILIRNNYEVVAVVTAPDKPAGRGLQVHEPAVKKYALQMGIPIMQPVRLKDPDFIQELRSFNANLFVIIAFRMLPEAVWKLPEYGSINLHASLLPDYRGAAPINWAIINGEKQTGVTTFFLQQEIDTGNIIFQKKIPIGENQNAGELHDELMEAGAGLVLATVAAIENDIITETPQPANGSLKTAPKIFRDDCKVTWNQSVKKVYDFIRGLAPYPGAWTNLNGKVLKIIHAVPEPVSGTLNPGQVDTDKKTYFRISTQNGWINVLELKLEGKKTMNIIDFLRGYQVGQFIIS